MNHISEPPGPKARIWILCGHGGEVIKVINIHCEAFGEVIATDLILGSLSPCRHPHYSLGYTTEETNCSSCVQIRDSLQSEAGIPAYLPQHGLPVLLHMHSEC